MQSCSVKARGFWRRHRRVDVLVADLKVGDDSPFSRNHCAFTGLKQGLLMVYLKKGSKLQAQACASMVSSLEVGEEHELVIPILKNQSPQCAAPDLICIKPHLRHGTGSHQFFYVIRLIKAWAFAKTELESSDQFFDAVSGRHRTVRHRKKGTCVFLCRSRRPAARRLADWATRLETSAVSPRSPDDAGTMPAHRMCPTCCRRGRGCRFRAKHRTWEAVSSSGWFMAKSDVLKSREEARWVLQSPQPHVSSGVLSTGLFRPGEAMGEAGRYCRLSGR